MVAVKHGQPIVPAVWVEHAEEGAALGTTSRAHQQGIGRAKILAAKTITTQARDLLQKYVKETDAGNLFYAVLYSERMLMVYDLTLLKLFNLPEVFVRSFRQVLAGRKMVYRLNQNRTAVLMLVSYEPVMAAVRRLDALPAFEGRQVIVYGPTGSGKTSAVQHLTNGRKGKKIFLDPHYAAGKGKWHSDSLVIGAGRKFEEVEKALALLVLEMSRRYELLASGQDGWETITLAVDELSAFASNIPNGAQHLITLAQEGRKVGLFVILTPHSPEVRQLGFEGKGGARDSFVFVQMPVIRPGEEQKPRIVQVYYGNPSHNDPDGRYLVPPPVVYQGEPRLIGAGELASLLGVSEGEAGPVSGRVAEFGHAPDTAQAVDLTDDASFAARYGRDSEEALKLAVYLVQKGYGVRKISELLPYQAERARATAGEALANSSKGFRPGQGSQTEVEMVRELYFVWGVPVNRLARLLDGADHVNVQRVEKILFSGGIQ